MWIPKRNTTHNWKLKESWAMRKQFVLRLITLALGSLALSAAEEPLAGETGQGEQENGGLMPEREVVDFCDGRALGGQLRGEVIQFIERNPLHQQIDTLIDQRQLDIGSQPALPMPEKTPQGIDQREQRRV